MKKIMAVNAGSSSIKFQLLQMPEENVIASGIMERIGLEMGSFTLKYGDIKEERELPLADHGVGVELLLKVLVSKGILSGLGEITGVGHRVVQGGEHFKDSTVITDEVIAKIEGLNDLAPLHNPANIVGILAFRKALPDVIQVAVFDTVFHQTMPEDTFMYATPYHWYTDYAVRKYGFHGTSHQYVSERCLNLAGLKKNDSKIVVCHMGNGASICAVQNGKSIDTSMGLTPLEGIPMGTRSGNIDPAIIELISRKENAPLSEIISQLNKKSGYLGISGRSNDARDVTKAMNAGDQRARLTFDIQAKRICDYIGSYYVLMGGIDAIAFTAGIGENVTHLRENVCRRLSVLGVKLDIEKNNQRGVEASISQSDSKVKVFIIPTNEEVMIARDVMRIGKL